MNDHEHELDRVDDRNAETDRLVEATRADPDIVAEVKRALAEPIYNTNDKSYQFTVMGALNYHYPRVVGWLRALVERCKAAEGGLRANNHQYTKLLTDTVALREQLKEAEAKAEDAATCHLCHCCLDAPDRHGEILGQWVERAEAAEARVADAMRLLNPTNPDETLHGAINNLRQVAFSERGNAEEAEARVAVLEQRLEKIVADVKHVAVTHAGCGDLEGCSLNDDVQELVASLERPTEDAQKGDGE